MLVEEPLDQNLAMFGLKVLRHESAHYRRLQDRRPHPLEIPAGALQRLDPGVDPRKMLLDGGDDVALLSNRRDGQRNPA